MKKVISLITAIATAVSPAVAFANTERMQNDTEFMSKAAALVTRTMSEDYIGSLSLRIGSDTMSLDGEELKIDNEGSMPVIENGTTLLPIRGVAEAIGAEVGYDALTQTVSLYGDETEVSMQIGSTSIEINGEKSHMPTAPRIENDRTLVPLRAAAQALGCFIPCDFAPGLSLP